MGLKIDSEITIRLGKIFIPSLIGIGVIILVGLFIKQSLRFRYWPLVTGYFFPPLGKESIIPIGIYEGINPLIMALSIAFVDFIVAWFLVWNYDLAKKIPFIGKFMTNIEEKGKNAEEKYSWIKPLRFIGIVLFVMIPFQGSGGLVGSIVGRLIGMKPLNTLYAITLGAVIGCILIAVFSHVFLEFSKINSTITLIFIGIIVVSVLIYVVLKKIRRKK